MSGGGLGGRLTLGDSVFDLCDLAGFPSTGDEGRRVPGTGSLCGFSGCVGFIKVDGYCLSI
jgi:hypothetical protein